MSPIPGRNMFRKLQLTLLFFVQLFMTDLLPAMPPGSGIFDNSSPLLIRFTGLRNNEGQIAIGITSQAEGWPRAPEHEYAWEKKGASDGVLEVSVTGLKPGTYAVTVLDDENSNLEMDMTLGIPREGWGFSGNPPFRLSVPRFGECAFRLDPGGSTITIELRYAGGRKRD